MADRGDVIATQETEYSARTRMQAKRQEIIFEAWYSDNREKLTKMKGADMKLYGDKRSKIQRKHKENRPAKKKERKECSTCDVNRMSVSNGTVCSRRHETGKCEFWIESKKKK